MSTLTGNTSANTGSNHSLFDRLFRVGEAPIGFFDPAFGDIEIPAYLVEADERLRSQTRSEEEDVNIDVSNTTLSIRRRANDGGPVEPRLSSPAANRIPGPDQSAAGYESGVQAVFMDKAEDEKRKEIHLAAGMSRVPVSS